MQIRTPSSNRLEKCGEIRIDSMQCASFKLPGRFQLDLAASIRHFILLTVHESHLLLLWPNNNIVQMLLIVENDLMSPHPISQLNENTIVSDAL